ncbi:Amino acid kinase family protein [Pirellula sp. SH-Sr6A]|uniref:amino acid kinase family protein n=1 Tax=Pirellula sp. SH-Sr6A TaxID=1632865 RepID=UPI00078EAB25|nr:hypothetical protein [Pirellula sp. SH-Sr6A]AMV35000.1 Amino acid kinase family protein [Pirellula sp. SH-Sr6A]
MGARLKLVVLKIGGSILFSEKSLSEQVDALQKEYRGCQVFVVVGGGEIVEAMRQLHRLRPELDMGWIHWECVRLLDSTFAISRQMVTTWEPVTTSTQLSALLVSGREGVYLVRIQSFYNERTPAEMEIAEVRPAESWDTTTDALAWYLAWRISAEEVCLLKSCPWPEGAAVEMEQLERLAEVGVVDRELPRLARLSPGIRIYIRSTAT